VLESERPVEIAELRSSLLSSVNTPGPETEAVTLVVDVIEPATWPSTTLAFATAVAEAVADARTLSSTVTEAQVEHP